MIDFFFPTDAMGSQTLRLVAEAQQGGGEVFDIARLCRDLDPNDKKGWERAWLDLARRTEDNAREACPKGTNIRPCSSSSRPTSTSACPTCS